MIPRAAGGPSQRCAREKRDCALNQKGICFPARLLLAEVAKRKGAMGKPEKIRLGDLLVQQRVISSEQLKLALDQQKRSGRKLGKVLVERAFVTEDEISESLARQLGVSFINLKYFN